MQACGCVNEEGLSFNRLLVPVNLVPKLQGIRAKEDADLGVIQGTQTAPQNEAGA